MTRPRARGRTLAWVFAVLLALVGVVGFVAANNADSHNEKSYAADFAALGPRDADTEAKALDARLVKVQAGYDAYVASMDRVHTRHEAVTDQFNEVVSPLNPDNLLGIQQAQDKLPRVIAAYEAAVKRQQVRMRAYVRQLAVLKARAAR